MNKLKLNQNWWTWIIPFPLVIVGVGLYLLSNHYGAHLSLYFPHFITLALALWWGPQVIAGSLIASLLTSRLMFPDFTPIQSTMAVLYCEATVGVAWLLTVRWQNIKIDLLENKSLIRFIIYGSLLPSVLFTNAMYLTLSLTASAPMSFQKYFFSMTVYHVLGTLLITTPLLMYFTHFLKRKALLINANVSTNAISFFQNGYLKERLQTFAIIFLLSGLSYFFPLNTHWFIFTLLIFYAATRLRLVDTLLINLSFIFLHFLGPYLNFYGHLTVGYFDGSNIDGEITLITFFFSSLIISTALSNLKEEITAHQETEARLQDASLAKSEFLARMSHEIRTPLNAILGMMDLLKTTQLSDEQKRYIQSFGHAGENLQALINDILDISKIEARQVRIESVPFNFRDTIKNVFEVLEQRAESKGILFTFHIDESVPENLLNDPTRIRQILLNLLSNALKFTEKGFVSLHVKEKINTDKMPVLLFEITDSGIGITKEKQLHLFQSFSQADSSIHRRFGGTGLGLAICKNLVELMGGKIWLESVENKGTKFFFELPYKVAPIRKLNLTKNSEETAAYFDTDKVFKVMIVDDSEDNLLLLRHFLKNKPIELIEARNGQEAIDNYSQTSIDMILMDIQMPVLDGHAATQRIREIEKATGRKYIPILALSANALAEEINKSISVGCNEHLVKPVSKHTLDESLKRYLF